MSAAQSTTTNQSLEDALCSPMLTGGFKALLRWQQSVLPAVSASRSLSPADRVGVALSLVVGDNTARNAAKELTSQGFVLDRDSWLRLGEKVSARFALRDLLREGVALQFRLLCEQCRSCAYETKNEERHRVSAAAAVQSLLVTHALSPSPAQLLRCWTTTTTVLNRSKANAHIQPNSSSSSASKERGSALERELFLGAIAALLRESDVCVSETVSDALVSLLDNPLLSKEVDVKMLKRVIEALLQCNLPQTQFISITQSLLVAAKHISLSIPLAADIDAFSRMRLSVCFTVVTTVLRSSITYTHSTEGNNEPRAEGKILGTVCASLRWLVHVFLSLTARQQTLTLQFCEDILSSQTGTHSLCVRKEAETTLTRCIDALVSEQFVMCAAHAATPCDVGERVQGFEEVLLSLSTPHPNTYFKRTDIVVAWNISLLGAHFSRLLINESESKANNNNSGAIVKNEDEDGHASLLELVIKSMRCTARARLLNTQTPRQIFPITSLTCEQTDSQAHQNMSLLTRKMSYYFTEALVLNLRPDDDCEFPQGTQTQAQTSMRAPLRVVRDIAVHWLWPCALEDAFRGTVGEISELDAAQLLRLAWERHLLCHYFLSQYEDIDHTERGSDASCLQFVEFAKLLCQLNTTRWLLRQLRVKCSLSSSSSAKLREKKINKAAQVGEDVRAQVFSLHREISTFFSPSTSSPYLSQREWRRSLQEIGVFSRDRGSVGMPSALHYNSPCAVLAQYLHSLSHNAQHTPFENLCDVMSLVRSLLLHIAEMKPSVEQPRFSSSTFLRELAPMFPLYDNGFQVQWRPTDTATQSETETENNSPWWLLVDNKAIFGGAARRNMHVLLLILSLLTASSLLREQPTEALTALQSNWYSIENPLPGNMSPDDVCVLLEDLLIQQRDLLVVLAGCETLRALNSIVKGIEPSLSCSSERLSLFHWRLLHTVFPECFPLPLQCKLSRSRQSSELEIGLDPLCVTVMETLLGVSSLDAIDAELFSVNKDAGKTCGDLLRGVGASWDFDSKDGTLCDVSKDRFILLHLFKLWWANSSSLRRIGGAAALSQELFRCFLSGKEATQSKKKKLNSLQNSTSTLSSSISLSLPVDKCCFPHASQHTVDLHASLVLAVLPSLLLLAPTCTERGCSPFTHFISACQLFVWVFHRLSTVLCTQEEEEMLVVANQTQLIIKTCKAALEAVEAKLVSLIRWRNSLATAHTIPSEDMDEEDTDEEETRDPGALSFLGTLMDWAATVSVSVRRFEELYENVFTVKDSIKQRFRTLDAAIDKHSQVLEELCQLHSLEVDFLHASDLMSALYTESLPQSLQRIVLSNPVLFMGQKSNGMEDTTDKEYDS